jgi:hypothetical protein
MEGAMSGEILAFILGIILGVMAQSIEIELPRRKGKRDGE